MHCYVSDCSPHLWYYTTYFHVILIIGIGNGAHWEQSLNVSASEFEQRPQSWAYWRIKQTIVTRTFSRVQETTGLLVFLSVKNPSFKSCNSRMPHHQIPLKDCSNVQDPSNSTKAHILLSENFSRMHLRILGILKSPTVLCIHAKWDSFNDSH